MGYLCKDFPTGTTQETSIAEKLKGKVFSTFYLLARYNRGKPYKNHVKTIQFIRGYNLSNIINIPIPDNSPFSIPKNAFFYFL